jgi:hypothetical protein
MKKERLTNNDLRWSPQEAQEEENHIKSTVEARGLEDIDCEITMEIRDSEPMEG